MELWNKYRPKNLGQMAGQDSAVKILQEKLDSNSLPHALLLTGPSGTGKTTAARILKRALNCSDLDFLEINAAKERGIETVRDVSRRMMAMPLGGECRIYLFDEAHQLVKRAQGDAQTAMLKMLEDTPRHVYFFLATTDPAQMLNTIRTRCMEIKFGPLPMEALKGLIVKVMAKEKVKFSDELVERIAETAEGSARKALNLADSVMGLTDESQRLEAVQGAEKKRVAFDLVKMLVWERAKWPAVAKCIRELDEGEDWEGVRRLVLKCASNELLKANGNAPKAYLTLLAFESPFFDSGRAQLTRACYEVFSGNP
jgi:DNA polymerase III subunit gamma/tau